MRKTEEIWTSAKDMIKELRRLQRLEKKQEILLKRRVGELMAVRELGKLVRSVLRADTLARVVIKFMVRKLKADCGSIMFLNKKTEELVIAASCGMERRKAGRRNLRKGEGLAGWSVEKKKPVYCSDMEKDPLFCHISGKRYRKREFMCAPLISRGMPIGVINIEKYGRSPVYVKEDLALLSLFANEVTANFENAFLFENIQRAYYETIKALVIAMESKDPYMQGHGERVAGYAVRLARNMGLPKEDIKIINFFSILHDIGKIGVPENVLLKPGRLTKKEWVQMKKHPIIGESIIEPIVFLQPVRTLLRHHHEWYNGRGYPDGLKGEDIAIAARILAVADAFDAMQSDRPYRNALSRDTALKEIKKASGTQFDPKVVDALINIYGKKRHC